MPLVQEKVSEFFGKEPKKDVNPDEAVARVRRFKVRYWRVM